MPTSSDLLRCAAAEIGYCRFDDPQAGTKYGRWYANLVGNSYYGQSGVPYCAMFVSWCLDQCGITATGFPSAYTPDLTNAARRAGIDKRAANLVQGDIVLFDWDRHGYSGSAEYTDHVGLVVSNTGSTLYTIEGNTTGSDGRSGSVAYRSRAYADVVCGYTPNYVEEKPKEFDEVATEAEIKSAVQSVVTDAVNTAKADAVSTVDARVGKVAGEVWDFNYNGQKMAERLYLCNFMDYDESDPTGRGQEYNNHVHIKYIAGAVQDVNDKVETTEQKIETLEATMDELKDELDEILELLQTK